MRTGLLLVLVLAACGEQTARPKDVAATPASVDRDTWWDSATKRPSGKERILAPRELRALVAEGTKRGYVADDPWWTDRTHWAYDRILSVDPDDLEANAGKGRKTLQSIPGFAKLWRRMLEADPTDELVELLDQYEVWVRDGQPVFLTADEYEVMQARLRRVRAHLERTEGDPGYAALQRALRRVRRGPLSDYPYVHVQVGPFLVFYTARDMQRVPGEEGAAEDARIKERREYYRRRLEVWTPVYQELLDDIAKLYPGIWQKHPLGPRAIFFHWVFGEQSWYEEFKERLHKENPEQPYRAGWFNAANGWAYLVEPPEPAAPVANPPGGAAPAPEPDDPVAVLRETAAYLAATQLMRHWARDRKDPTENHLDRSRAYWIKEGWPAYLASLRVEKPRVGRTFELKWTLPTLASVVERRSRLQRLPYLTSPEGVDWAENRPPDEGYSDLAWLLIQHLSEKETKAKLEAFLNSQLDGSKRGIEWFEKCFGVKGADGWAALQRRVYKPLSHKGK